MDARIPPGVLQVMVYADDVSRDGRVLLLSQ